MLVKLGALVAVASGAMGGIVAARNRSGAYLRNRTIPVDPSSTAQNIQRSRMAAGASLWRALTEAQRQAWNAKAATTAFVNRVGETIHLTGMNLFVRSSNLLQSAGLGAITDPPVNPIIQDHGSSTAYSGATGLDMLSDADNWPVNAVLLVSYAIDLPNSKNYYKGPYPLSTTLALADFTAGVALLVAFGDLQDDSVQACSFRLVAEDGSASSVRYSRTTNAA